MEEIKEKEDKRDIERNRRDCISSSRDRSAEIEKSDYATTRWGAILQSQWTVTLEWNSL